MNIRISRMAVLLTLATLSAMAAQAAEITLYQDSGFRGRQVTLMDYTPNISDVGFNDRASSIVVRSGRWEVCTDAEFNGYCTVLERGEYRELDPRFNDRISSMREVGTTASRAGGLATGARGPAVELFGQPGFRGKSIRLEGDANNFDSVGFNDRASSLIVHEGTWVLCTDADYRGTCRNYAPGRYADLGYGMSSAVSSARIVPVHNETRPIHGGGWGGPTVTSEAAQIVLYDSDGIHGRSMAVSGNVVDLGPTGFNDATASMVIQSGYWEFCSDAYFHGQCRVLGPGKYRRLDPELYRSISSIRAASREGTIGSRSVPGRGDIELFSSGNFGGRRLTANRDMQNLDSSGFNDQTASIMVYSGQWEVCTDANFRGRCSAFGPGRYANLGGLTNQISSLRRIY